MSLSGAEFAHNNHIFAGQLLLSAEHCPGAGEETEGNPGGGIAQVPEGGEGHSGPRPPAGGPVCRPSLEAFQPATWPSL